MPSCAALMPVNNVISPLMAMASRMPLPATAVAEPRAAKMPVPMIMAAVTSVAAAKPSVRGNIGCDVGFP